MTTSETTKRLEFLQKKIDRGITLTGEERAFYTTEMTKMFIKSANKNIFG